MAEKKKNIFKSIGQKFKEIRLELKKVVWPSKDKMKSTSAIVLLAILFFAIFLTVVGTGTNKLFELAGFYDENEETTTTTTVVETSVAPIIETYAEETEA